MWHATVVTLFPEMFPGPLGASIPHRAMEKELWHLDTLQIRDFAFDKHQSVDDTPFGGGAGMVMKAEVIHQALLAAKAKGDSKRGIIHMSPRGRPLTQQILRDNLLKYPEGVILLCGRYEGIDQRVIDLWKSDHNLEEISIGDYILSGGEVAAQVYLDASVRLLENAVGSKESTEIESFELDLLEFSQYTKPYAWENILVPDVLVSGHHEKIAAFRFQQACEITRLYRPDLWEIYQAKNEGRKK